jgi:peptidoglycan biosynthesis protein MviN/MurJ (putative lipid II flippase)
VLLGSGQFDWGDTRLTAAVLAIFIISLCAQAILLLLTRAFYACGKTFTPLWIAIISGGVTILSALWLRDFYLAAPDIRSAVEAWLRLSSVSGTEVLTLVTAFAFGQLVQLTLMMIVSVRLFNINYSLLWRLLWQSILASISGAFVAYGTLAFIVDGVNQDTFIGISLQGFTAGVAGLATVILVYHLSRSLELQEVSKSLHSRFLKENVIVPQQDTL